jgi:hypothetical protein
VSLLAPILFGVLVPLYLLVFEKLSPDDEEMDNESRLFHVDLALKLFAFTIRWVSQSEIISGRVPYVLPFDPTATQSYN